MCHFYSLPLPHCISWHRSSIILLFLCLLHVCLLWTSPVLYVKIPILICVVFFLIISTYDGRTEGILNNSWQWCTYVLCFLLGNSPASEFYMHIKFRPQGITQKKTYNIQNMVKVWNQEWCMFVLYWTHNC